jgi:hypothetical protein
MTDRFKLYLIVFLGAVVCLLLLTRGCGKPEPVIPPPKTDTVTVISVVHDTIKIEITKRIYVERAVPVIVDSVALLDTGFTVIDDGALRIDARLSLGYDLRKNLFQDVALWFPTIEYPHDTVYVNKYIKETIYKAVKTSKWRYVEAGLVGAALGLTVYAVAQGL